MKSDNIYTNKLSKLEHTPSSLNDSRLLIAEVEGRLEWYFQDLEQLIKK